MAIKYCPNCEELGETKVVPSGYKQLRLDNSVIKRRKLTHRVEDGGCDHTWYTYEIPENVLQQLAPAMFQTVIEV